MYRAIVIWLAMCAVWAHAEIIKPLNPDRQPAITIRYPLVTAPKITTAPALDGVLDEGEWKYAVRLLPLLDYETGTSAREQTTTWLCYDDDNLYIAFRVVRPIGSPPPLARHREAAYVEVVLKDIFGDPRSTSFSIDPRGQRTAGHYQPDFVRTEPGDKGEAWQAKVRSTENGYDVELAIPFRLLYRRTPSPGDTWEFQLFSHSRHPQASTQALIPLGLSNAAPFAYLRFGSTTTPGLHLVPASGKPGIEVSAFSKSDVKLDLKAELFEIPQASGNIHRLFDRLGKSRAELAPAELPVSTTTVIHELSQAMQLKESWDRKLEAASYRDGSIKLEVNGELRTGVMHVRFRDADGALMLAASQPVSTHALGLQTRWSGSPKRQLWCQSTPAPWLKAPAGARLRARLLDSNGNTLVQAWSDTDQFRVAVPREFTGDARLQVSLSVDSREIAVDQQEICIPEAPPWRGNSIGTYPTLPAPPKPWEPIRPNDGDLEFTGGSVALLPTLLPGQIQRQEQEFLAGPMTLAVESSRPLTPGPVRTLERDAWHVRLGLDYSGQSMLKGSLTLDAAYDGFLRYQLALEPVGQRNVPLRVVTLRIPLRKDRITYYRLGPGETRAYRSHTGWRLGKVPAEGLSVPFTSCLWLGDERSGLELVMPSDRHWFPLNRQDAIQIVPEGDAMIVTVRFVVSEQDSALPERSRQLTIDERIVYEWGLMTAPTHPDAKERASLRMVTDGLNVSPLTMDIDSGLWATRLSALRQAGANAVWFQAGANVRGPIPWHPDGPQPGFDLSQADANWRLQSVTHIGQLAKQTGISHCLLDVYGDIPSRWERVAPYRDVLTTYPPITNGRLFQSVPGNDYTDWFLYKLASLLDKTQVNGVVLSNGAFPLFSADPAAGTGWFDESGDLRGAYPVFAMRTFHERLWLALHGGLIDDGLVVVTTQAFPYACVNSFIDALVLTSRAEVEDAFPAEPWRLAVHGGSDVDGLPVLHDAATLPSRWGLQLEAAPVLAAVDLLRTPQSPAARSWLAYGRFPWAESQHIGPWAINDWVGNLPDTIIADLRLAKGHAAMLTVSNTGDTAVQANLLIDITRFGLPVDYRATEVATDEEYGLYDGNTLRVMIPAKDWRMFYFEPLPTE